MDHVNVEMDSNVTELIFVSLPLEEAHDTHIISRESGSCQRVKPEVREKILSLVASGVTSTAVVKLLLERYVLEEMNHPGGILPAKSDNGYFPKNSDIMNYIRRGRVQVHNPASDLQNLENEMQERRVQEGESLDLSTSFRISSNLTLDNGFLPAEIELDNSGSVLSEKQAALREKLKLLTDLTYITTDLTVLQTASSALDSCIEIMQTSIKEENDKRKHTEKQVKVKSQPVRSQSCQKECSRLKKKQKVNKGK